MSDPSSNPPSPAESKSGAAPPVCGELLILGKSAIRHTQAPGRLPRSRASCAEKRAYGNSRTLRRDLLTWWASAPLASCTSSRRARERFCRIRLWFTLNLRATPFEMNFMTGKSPSWRRNLYYRLVWKKASGAKLVMVWRFEQGFYPDDGWTSGTMSREGSTGLLQVDVVGAQ